MARAAKVKRGAIPTSVRFEVFKRDSFTCQYCGTAAPDVILEIDHIQPVSKSGEQRNLLNLITACRGCNSGKSDRLLSDDTVAKKQKRQLDELQERREQLEMIAQWQIGLADLDGQAVKACASLWEGLAKSYHLNDSGLTTIRKLIKQFGMADVMAGIRMSCSHYMEVDADGKVTQQSAEESLSKIGGVCYLAKQGEEHPELKEAYRIRAMMRARIGGFTQWENHKSLEYIKSLMLWGYTPDDIRRFLTGIDRWGAFEDIAWDKINDAKEAASGGKG